MKVKIEVAYNLTLTDETREKIKEIDTKIKEKIESIGGKWYAQGAGIDNIQNVYYDLEIEIESESQTNERLLQMDKDESKGYW